MTMHRRTLKATTAMTPAIDRAVLVPLARTGRRRGQKASAFALAAPAALAIALTLAGGQMPAHAANVGASSSSSITNQDWVFNQNSGVLTVDGSFTGNLSVNQNITGSTVTFDNTSSHTITGTATGIAIINAGTSNTGTISGATTATTINGANGDLAFGSTLSSTTINVAGTGSITTTGALTNSGNVVYSANGSLILNGSGNTIGGTITTSGGTTGQGTLTFGSASGNTTITGAAGTSSNYLGIVNVYGTGTNTFSSDLYAATLIYDAAGTVAVAGSARLTTVSFGANSGTLSLGGGGTVGTIAASGSGTSGNGTITLTGTTNTTFSSTVGTATDYVAAININAAQTATFSDNVYTAGLSSSSTSAIASIASGKTLTAASGSFGGVISGSGSLAKSGTGTLTLTGANTYSGGTTLSGSGTLVVGSNTALGSGSLTISSIPGSATITSNGSAVTLNNAITVSSNYTIGGSSDLTLAGAMTLNTDGTVTVNNTGTTTISGVISGTNRSITIAGSGTLVLSGANTFNYGVNITGTGTVDVRNTAALGTGTLNLDGNGASIKNGSNAGLTLTNAIHINKNFTVANGSALSFSGAISLDSSSGITLANASGTTFTGNIALSSNTLFLAGSQSGTFSGNITGTGGLVYNGSGTVTLSGASSTYSGGTTLSGTGTVVVTNENALGQTNGPLTINSGTLDITQVSAIHITALNLNGGTLKGNAAVFSVFGNVAIPTLSSSANVEFYQTTDASYAGVVAGSGNLVKSGSGTLTITSAQTYSGYTYVNGGTLRLGAGGSLVNYQNVVVATGAAFDAGAVVVTLGSLNGGGSVQVANGGATVNSGTFSGVFSGTGQLTKAGTDTLFISGNSSSFTGGLAVTGGTVSVSGILGSSGSSNGAVAVASGSNLIGTGTVGGTTATVASGGTVTGTGLTIAAPTVTVAGTVTGTTTLQGKVTVSGLINGNPTIVGDVAVTSGGTLGGTGSITGNVQVASGATLAPGNSPGILTITGNFTQAAGSTYAVDVDGTGTGVGAGNYDRIIVTGTYTAGGVLAPRTRGITGSATNTYTPSLGQEYTIVTAAGGVLGSYSSLTQPTTGLASGTRFDAIYDANAINLIVTPSSYANLALNGVSQTANQQSVGSALDTLRPAAGVRPSGNTKTLYDALYRTSGNLATLTSALESLTGVLHAETATAVLQTHRTFGTVLEDRLSDLRSGGRGSTLAGNMTGAAFAFDGQHSGAASAAAGGGSGLAAGDAGGNKLSTWATPFGSFGSVDGDGNGPGSDRSAGGVVLGADYSVLPGLDLGALFGYGRTWVDGKNGSGKADVNSYVLGAYGSYRSGGFFGTVGLTHSFDDYDTTRQVTVGALSTQAKGKADGGDTAVEARGGYRFNLSGTGVEPSLALRYDHLTRDGFSESNASGLGLTLKEQSVDAIRTTLGVKVDREFKYGEAYTLRPSARVGWNHDFGDESISSKASLLGSSFAVKGAKVGRDGVGYGVGITASNGSAFSLYADYSGEARSGSTDHNFKAGLRVTW